MQVGRLILLVGPSGAGKDSLIQAIRASLAHRCDFPARYITRPLEAGGEQHHAVSIDEFRALLAQGRMAVHWQAHGLHYGVPIEIEQSLAAGRDVLLNVSRAKVADFEARYNPVIVVAISADPAALEQRLRQRGRESDADVRQRLQRTVAPIAAANLIEIDNSGALSDSTACLLAHLDPSP